MAEDSLASMPEVGSAELLQRVAREISLSEIGEPVDTVDCGLFLASDESKYRSGASPAEWFFSGTAFAGAKIPITRHIGLRTQIRFLGTLINSDTSFICISNGGAVCKISVRDVEGLIQGDVTAGIYIAF